MRVLWAPWRMAYVGGARTSDCIFCTARDSADTRATLVLAQRPAIVMLNRYPYANGHLMVAPRHHAADFAGLPAAECRALMDSLARVTTLLAEAMHSEGMNVGLNLGAAAGAGVADHMHWHIVPRWSGDTNFMPLLADTRIISQHLEILYDRLQPVFSVLDAA